MGVEGKKVSVEETFISKDRIKTGIKKSSPEVSMLVDVAKIH